MKKNWKVRLAVIVNDGAMAANIGGGVQVDVRTFDLPPDIESYIASQLGNGYVTVQLGIDAREVDLAGPVLECQA